MKKIDIEKAIYKNLEVLKYEQLYRIYDKCDIGIEYLSDKLGVKELRDYSKIENMYKGLNVTGCDCRVLEHNEDYDEDGFFPSSYPFQDECILCHTVYTSPRRHSMWFREKNDKDRVGHYSSLGDIKYKIYKTLLMYIKDFNDNDDIDIHEVLKKMKEEDYYFLKEADIHFDNRKKENYRVLVVLGSNDIKIGDSIVQPDSQKEGGSLVKRLAKEETIKFDVLKHNDDSSYPYSARNVKVYNYSTVEDVDNFFKDLESENVEYDLVIDLSNIKEIEEVNGKYFIKDYDLKNKVNSDYFITFRNKDNMTDEDIIKDSENHDPNEEIYYHSYNSGLSHYSSVYRLKDGEVRGTFGNVLTEELLDTLYDESKVSQEEKAPISKRLSRKLSYNK